MLIEFIEVGGLEPVSSQGQEVDLIKVQLKLKEGGIVAGSSRGLSPAS
jgi:hypothetical protein